MKIGLAICLGFLQVFFYQTLSCAEQPFVQTKERLEGVLKVLNKSERGRELTRQAMEFWKVNSVSELSSFLKWSTESRTDAIIVRQFDPKTGNEERQREVSVSLKSSQVLHSVVLDLAHELSHALSKPAWDPYDPKLGAAEYIFSAIEGHGGEIEAVKAECEVAIELATLGEEIDKSRCQSYVDRNQILENRVRADFYRVGSWYSRLAKQLGPELKRFPALSAEAPKLFSSTGHSPYPVALLQEYEEMNWVACENSLKRLQNLKGRSIAAVRTLSQPEESIREFIKNRCSSQRI